MDCISLLRVCIFRIRLRDEEANGIAINRDLDTLPRQRFRLEFHYDEPK
jgi:hypothetical protein